MGTGKSTAGGKPAMDWHPIQGGVEILLVASCKKKTKTKKKNKNKKNSTRVCSVHLKDADFYKTTLTGKRVLD